MLSLVVITRNEEAMIADCLQSASGLAGETVLVDTGNTDRTNKIARSLGARIVKASGTDYSHFRNVGLSAARGDWILFLDADERLSPGLYDEIRRLTSRDKPGVFKLPRKNIYLGREMHHGGWGGDYVIRLFHASLIKKFTGALHEQPVFLGQLQAMSNPLIHFSHRDLSSMLDKTLQFSDIEAALRFRAGHPPVVWWRFIRVMAGEFWFRFIRQSAWKDGAEGIIDGAFQVFNTFIIYARLWEMQHAPKTSRHF